jgi:hypothetical protein
MYIIVASHKITWRKRGATDGAIADPKIEKFSRTQIRKGEYRYISISFRIFEVVQFVFY